MTNGRLLLVLDDSPASKRAVAYVASMVGSQQGLRVYLVHLLPPLPARLLECKAADGILKLARANRCDTVVVGRRSVPWLRKLLNTELAAELVRRGAGFTIWVVE